MSRPDLPEGLPQGLPQGLPEDLARAAEEAVAPIPRDPEGAPVFRAPWEAQAFALALALHARGVFTWSEWAQALGAEIRRAGGAADACGDGSDYYRHWLAAVERLVAERGLATPAALSDRREAWARAAHATPHGAPVRLENDPGRG